MRVGLSGHLLLLASVPLAVFLSLVALCFVPSALDRSHFATSGVAASSSLLVDLESFLPPDMVFVSDVNDFVAAAAFLLEHLGAEPLRVVDVALESISRGLGLLERICQRHCGTVLGHAGVVVDMVLLQSCHLESSLCPLIVLAVELARVTLKGK